MLNWVSKNKREEFPKQLMGCPDKCEYHEWIITRKIKIGATTIGKKLVLFFKYIKKFHLFSPWVGVLLLQKPL